MLDFLTFTGVDRETPMKELLSIAQSYGQAHVEFGVLVGSHSGESDHGIFPSLHIVRAVKSLRLDYGVQMAIHLCGRYSRMVMQDDGVPDEVYDLCHGFSRVQVNLHGDSFNPGRVAVASQAVKRFADTVGCQRVILQHRGGWSQIPVFHEKVEYLFDKSEGGGRAAFEEWPAPTPHLPRMGYAGGIGPETIDRAIDFALAYPDSNLWFDMEGRIRFAGWLDLDAVETVCETYKRYAERSPVAG